MILLCLLVVFALWYVALRMRAVPVEAMRTWFLITNLLTIFPMSAITFFIDALRYVGVPRYYTQRMCILPLCLSFRLAGWLNPQIRIRTVFDANEGGKPTSFSDIPTNGVAYVANHTSFFDVYEFINNGPPLFYLLNTRTLMKSSLRKIPIFGGIFDRVGHFPVYFKSDEDGNFQVDKERQAKVQVRVDEHLANGGNLAIFPEGAVNKNPKVLQTFRFGTFSTIFEHRLKPYYMVIVGNEKTWPRDAPYGGAPADIVIRIGAYPIDFDNTDSKRVASEMQAFMQKIYDEVLAEQENSSKKHKKA